MDVRNDLYLNILVVSFGKMLMQGINMLIKAPFSGSFLKTALRCVYFPVASGLRFQALTARFEAQNLAVSLTW